MYEEKTTEELLKVINEMTIEILSLRDHLQEAEEGNTPMYCPTCTSCGVDGCCSPDACIAVMCLYGEGNAKSWKDSQKENNILWNFLEECKQSEMNERACEVEEQIKNIWISPLEK